MNRVIILAILTLTTPLIAKARRPFAIEQLIAQKIQEYINEGTSMDLTKKQCVACEGKTRAFNESQEADYLKAIPNWAITQEGIHKISRQFKFKDFKTAMKFINAVADIAEHQQHHPDIVIHYNMVTLELYTHAIKGLSENDFIVAALINELAKKDLKI